MTNYINEMMETAEIIKIYDRECEHKLQKYCDENACYDPYFHPYPLCVGYEKCTQKYKKRIEYYPDFTAEKQLEIIKVIAGNKDFYINKIGSEWELSALTETNLEGILEEHNKDFPQALAQLTTELMNAGELDKKKVKEILEDENTQSLCRNWR